MKKIASVVIISVMVISGFVFLEIIPFEKVKGDFETNAPYDGGNGNPIGDGVWENDIGDWVISWSISPDFIEYTNITIILNGNLIIEPDAELIFRNVTLMMNVAFDGEFKISVQSGGILRILDNDNDQATTLDASVITSNTAYHFGFAVEGPNGFLEMNNSELHESGWGATEALQYRDAGLWIGASNITISGNYISNCYNGITIYGASTSNVVVQNNNISNCENGTFVRLASNITVDNNEFFEDVQGLDFNTSANVLVSNNKFNLINKYAALFEAVNTIEFNYNNIENLIGYMGWVYTAVFITDFSSNIHIEGNILHNLPYSGIFVWSYSGNVSFINNSNDNHYKQIALSASEGDSAYFYGNTVGINSTPPPLVDGMGIGVWNIAGHVDMINNSVYNMPLDSSNNYGSGLQLYNVQSATIYGNELSNNEGGGIYLYNSSNVQIEECNLNNNAVGVWTSNLVFNVLVENSTITAGVLSNYDFYLETDSYITTLNSTFDNSSTGVDSSSILTVKWYLHVKTHQGGLGINGVVVRINDSYGIPDPISGQPFTTQNLDGDDGWVKWIPITEYADSNNVKDYKTPHRINVTMGALGGYASQSLWKSETIFIELNGIPTVADLTAFPYFVNRTDTIYFFANGTDIEDFESQFSVEFQYRDPNNLSWNTSFLGSIFYYDTNANPNDDIGYWYVSFTPPSGAPTGWYDIRVRFQDTDGSYSEWYVLLDSVLVENTPPYVEIMYNISFGSAPPGFLYRGENAWIYGDGNDAEDGDDQNFITAEFQYKRPGESWGAHSVYWSPNTPQMGGGDWYQNFFPSASIDTPVGVYQFRMRFQDSVGLWGQWANMENLTVLNNPPQFIAFSQQSSEVYRSNTVRVFVDASDVEELESDLTVEFFYQHATFGTGWEQAWLSLNGNYVSGQFFADFTPPDTAEAGFYKFKIEISDQETPGVPGDTHIEDVGPVINVKNKPPIALNVKVSTDLAMAGIDTVFIHVNATDDYNSESELKIEEMWWRENNSASSQPPTRPWENDPQRIEMNLDQGYVASGGGYIRGSMKPTNDPNTYKGDYDIRLKVRDLESGVSSWIYLYNAFKVTNPAPLLLDYVVSDTEVFRGDTVYLFVNASDPSLDENDLTVEIQYRKDGTSQTWNNLDSIPSDYHGSPDSGHWAIPFTPSAISWPDSDLDEFEFRIRIWNGAVYSNDNQWNYTDNILIKNNLPEAVTLDAGSENTVERGSTITIFADGSDRETAEDDLDAYFEYSLDGVNWEALTGENFWNGRWEVEFTPDNVAELGNYHFQVRFHDGEDYSNYLKVQNLIEVTNAIPVVTSFVISGNSIFRLEDVVLTAIVNDADQDEATLTANFQFKGPTGSWIDIVSSEYFGGLIYLGNGQWATTFSAPVNAELGDYSFIVSFTDGDGATSNSMELIDYLNVLNNIPEIEDMTMPSSGKYLETITISVEVSDPETLSESLISTFEYKGPSGDWVSQEASESYFSSNPEFINGKWEIEFTPPLDAELGKYSLRVSFSDGIDTSGFMELIDYYELINDPPIIDDVTIPSTGLRLEPIDIYIDVTDSDTPLENLTISIEYKSPTGDWVSYEDIGSYFADNPEFVGGQWRIIFDPPGDAELGNYSFRVKTSDGYTETNWLTMTDTFTLNKNPDDPDEDGQLNDIDNDDDGDGTPDSTDEFPLNPNESVDTDGDNLGNNEDTDDDNDGILDVNDPEPLIPKSTEKKEPDNSLTFFFLILVLLTVIVLLLILTRGRKQGEGSQKINQETPDEIDQELENEGGEILEDIPEPIEKSSEHD
jgi:parallel beta-helix repeat protein